MRESTFISTPVVTYIEAINREDDVLKELRAETGALPLGVMQISSDEGAFLAMLVSIMKAKRVLEIGTYTGYSALVMAQALPKGGKIVTCENDEEAAKMARKFWKKAGVSRRIDLRLADARETLARLSEEGFSESFDIIFIDIAAKEAYDYYYETCLKLLRPKGLIIIDNTLWRSQVADPNTTDELTKSLQRLNAKIRADTRVEMCVLTICDGMTLAYKKP